MEVRIHPQSLVSPKAKIGQDVQIGPFCVVEDNVEIGDGCCLEARVTVHRDTVMGTNNHLFEGATIGGLPQCVGIGDTCGSVVIGNGNMIRENVTIHRAMGEADATEIGDNCMFMVNAHIAHDCRISDNVIMANNTMLAGHVTVGRRAFISGAVGVHQFCRIGAFAMVGGQSHIVKDIPPFLLVDGLTSEIVGLNNVGLRRAGFSSDEIKEIKAVYRVLYQSSLPWREIVNKIQSDFTSGPGLEMASFIGTTTRGITPERHTARHPAIVMPEEKAIHLHVVTEEEESAIASPYRRRVVG
ncbi:MAG: acyl-ACP--UDP-N-acetylglucosamine O-acyltransferase [Planctomycetia bacterium]|nr:acyl-ACP--UDP-N-acetylglucosamine O-acyltransferase [Planctomycetia bacterium]